MVHAPAMVDPRHKGIYTPAFIARIAGMRPDTVRRWLATAEKAGAGTGVVLRHPETGRVLGSFLDLVEMWMVGELLKRKIPLHKIRRQMIDLRTLVQGDHPLSRQKVLIDGTSVYLPVLDQCYRELGEGGQLGLTDIVHQRAEALVFDENGIASELRPRGTDHHIVIQPDVCFGAPRVVGTRILTETVLNAWRAEGEDVDKVARLYQLLPEQVQEAVRFEQEFKSAA